MTTNLDNSYNKYKNDLDQWTSFLCLTNREPNRSLVENILDLTLDDLKNKNPIEIAEYSFMLSQYSYFLQNKNNECECFLKWSRDNTKIFFNEDKIKITQWIKNIEMRLDRIKYLSKKIEVMCVSLSKLSRIKKYEPNK